MKVRAGAYGLSLLSDPLDVKVLRTLENGSLPLIELRRAVGSPPQTTLRKHLRSLTDLGVLVRERQHQFPAPVSYRLGPSGLGLVKTVDTVSAWLANAPNGPFTLGEPAAKSAIKSLVDAWTSKMLRALAVKPFSLTELDRLLPGINYPALERRLSAMRLTGQVVPVPSHGASTPYKVTRWLREAVGPLVASASWESNHLAAGGQPLRRIDVEAIFLLAIPLLNLPATVKGPCRLLVNMSDGRQDSIAGAVVVIEHGRPVCCVSDLQAEDTETRATGTTTAWLSALTGNDASRIELEGDIDLAEAIIAAFRRSTPSKTDGPFVVAWT